MRDSTSRAPAASAHQLKGLDKKVADELAERLAQDPEAMLKVQISEELGVSVKTVRRVLKLVKGGSQSRN